MNIKNQLKQLINNKVDDYVDSLGCSHFKKQITLEKRKEQSRLIMEKYPNRLPIICDVSKKLPDLDKHKYLIPEDLTSETFMYIIRKRITLKPEHAMYFFVNNEKLLQANNYMSEIYRKHKDEDGFLYIYVCAESTFG
jgi:GABA(A) receptor-associated protein